MADRIYNAIILNEPYADKVKERLKTIETRMRRMNIVGDLVICCDKGKSKHSKNSGKALCLVTITECREMVSADEQQACIECVPGRIAYPMTNWRYFSYPFEFTQYYVSGTYQGVFKVRIPDFVEIINL